MAHSNQRIGCVQWLARACSCELQFPQSTFLLHGRAVCPLSRWSMLTGSFAAEWGAWSRGRQAALPAHSRLSIAKLGGFHLGHSESSLCLPMWNGYFSDVSTDINIHYSFWIFNLQNLEIAFIKSPNPVSVSVMIFRAPSVSSCFRSVDTTVSLYETALSQLAFGQTKWQQLLSMHAYGNKILM